MRDKLDSFGGQGLDKIVEVDPAVVLELLDDNLVDRGNTGSKVVSVDRKRPEVGCKTFYIRVCKRRKLVV